MPKSQTPAAVLQSLMDEYQLNPFSLAKAINLSHSAARLLVIGKSKISVSSALRLAKLFGQTPDYWLNLQREADLNEASKDKELQDVLAAIPKAKKPAAPKPETAKNTSKKQKPTVLNKKTTITTAPRTHKNKGPKKVVKKK